jgi:hypothetical protein
MAKPLSLVLGLLGCRILNREGLVDLGVEPIGTLGLPGF